MDSIPSEGEMLFQNQELYSSSISESLRGIVLTVILGLKPLLHSSQEKENSWGFLHFHQDLHSYKEDIKNDGFQLSHIALHGQRLN